MAESSARRETLPREADSVPLALPPFADWTYQDAVSAVRSQLPGNFSEREDYAADRHWRNGDGWVGPRPDPRGQHATEALRRIEEQFSPYDACGEGLNALEDAFSAEAQIDCVPLVPLAEGEEMPADLQTLRDEAVNLLTKLWDRVRLHEQVKPTIRASAWAERAGLRWWIPPSRALRRVGEDGKPSGDAYLPRAESLEAAAEWLALSRPSPDRAVIHTDPATQERAAVYLDEIERDGTSVKRAVVAYRDGERTIWRAIFEGASAEAEITELETGGVLPLAEMRGDNLLTESVLRTQRQLDYIESVLTRTVETAGFPERYIANAEPTGNWVRLGEDEVPTGPTREFRGATYQLKPERRTLGASVTTELVGLVTSTEDGKQIRATPTVDRFEPVDPEFATKAADHGRAKILRMMRQAHRAITSAAEASGVAYEQARAPFLKDLLNRKGAVEGMLRDLLTAALGIVEALAGRPGYFTQRLRVTVDMHVDAGPRSPEERSQDRDDVAARLLSPETAISRGGVEDVEAEMARIATSNRLALLKEAAEVFELLTRSTSEDAAVRALIAAGVDEEIANALRRRDVDNTGDEG